MINKLFVYGTLAPGRPNEHILKDISGTWQKASTKGKLHQEGWGAAMGYPAIILDENGDDVAGFVFTCNELEKHLNMLDEFEGSQYLRVVTRVTLEDASEVNAYVYSLKV